MWLLDSNILRYYFGEKHPVLHLHLKKISRDEIVLPSVVLAEVLRGRCDFALKAAPSQLPLAHQQLLQTKKLLSQFKVIQFDEKCAEILEALQRKHKTHKRYADMMIAAIAKAEHHIVVTRNVKHFELLLPKSQIANWIDDKPT
ncbi:type II toxin-antitoxin system VapC family toxin [Candidatus Marithioploca araucensis]|uniref:Type II toxin-antitoxin system VapC family toxin n=1 Tax=Candidatus Marithioploca araucensis TaxID=70273 RepID=A0ABT7VS15_9GAMM|nr:type II toxin-antitoxin system VapC family toxin [Candidatus Marithioploca araucensis]